MQVSITIAVNGQTMFLSECKIADLANKPVDPAVMRLIACGLMSDLDHFMRNHKWEEAKPAPGAEETSAPPVAPRIDQPPRDAKPPRGSLSRAGRQ